MIHSLYTNKDIFLRELISNASDACDKVRYEALTHADLLKDDSELKITISVDKPGRAITISDNGVGMSREELIANLGTIAKSGTQDFLEKLTGDGKKDLPLIGQFGVGFYASFMVAQRVKVVSQRAGLAEAFAWESEGMGEFTVSEASREGRGTSITLFLKEGEDQYLDAFRLKHITQTYSDHISFPIAIVDAEGKSEVVNTASALWMRPKSDITPEQYKEFYHHVAHLPDSPWMTLHNRAEG
ncbi:MAG: ATP-binding protein, partial [Rickettsiales bacterium]|nr:ATP-binding protein [Rickettsiales bacterium]